MADLLKTKKNGPPKKEKAPASATNTNKGSFVSSSSKSNITDSDAKNKAGKKPKKAQKQQNNKYTMESSLKQYSIKCYVEQLPSGLEKLKQTIKEIPANEMQVLAIVHDKDFNKDDIWESAKEKPHIHIIGRYMDKKPRKIRTILNRLGIVFRQGIDDNVFRKNGMEAIRKFEAMAMYLTHETEQAMEDGKAWYDISEIFSNLDEDGIKQVRDGYVRITKNSKKISIEEMEELCQQAFKLGLEGKDFTEWYMTLPLSAQSNSRMKQCRERYNYGMAKGIEDRAYVNRLAVFIRGNANTGKTYAVKEYFKEKGLNYISIDAGGTGALDNLTVRTNAIIVDDANYHSLLRLSDNYACQVHRRGSNNPWWCGEYFIIISNKDIDGFLDDCGTKEDRNAIKSRFYICEIEEDEYCKDHNLPYKSLAVLRDDDANLLVSRRGTHEEQKERLDKFLDFKEFVDKKLNEYDPKKNKVDYSVLL